MSSLELLLNNVPKWFSVNRHFAHSVEGICFVIDGRAVADGTYSIPIEDIGSKVYAPRDRAWGDASAHLLRPPYYGPSHFCRGLGYGSIVRDAETAKLW